MKRGGYLKRSPFKAARKRNKFGAIRTTIGGITYASKIEAEVCQLRRLEVKAGHIDEYEEQKEFIITVAGKLICIYISDAFFRVVKTGKYVIEDIKGRETDVFRLKKKLVQALYPDFEFWITKRCKSGRGLRTTGQSYTWEDLEK